MLAFLIITSLSLAFYLVLLAALYRDGRKRRSVAGSLQQVDLEDFAEFGTMSAMNTAALPARQPNSTKVLVRVAKPKRADMLKSRSVIGKSAEVITIPTFARGKNDLQCS